MNGYELSRRFFDWSFENPEKINPNHSAIYFFAVEHCNRLGWRDKFGFPTQMAMDAIGIKKHQTYIKYFNDLVDWGFFIMIERSKNQYSSNIISLVNALPKNGEALDKAIIKHGAKQIASIGQSNSSIDKQLTNKPKTTKQPIPEFSDFLNYAIEKKPLIDEFSVRAKYDSWVENGWRDGNDNQIKNWKTKLGNTLPHLKQNNSKTQKNEQLAIFTSEIRNSDPRI